MIADWERGLAWLRQEGLEPRHLPHLLGMKLYSWSYDFITTKDRQCLLCGGNQISKSSSMIRKAIWLATTRTMWPHYFPERGYMTLIWYLYPSFETVATEWADKWREWMPAVPPGHPQHDRFGWKVQKVGSQSGRWAEGGFANDEVMGMTPRRILFSTGVVLEFRTYSQIKGTLQSSTVDMVCCDEELPEPEARFGELTARLNSTRGIYNMAFTATIGHQWWYRAMERIGQADEFLKGAWKRCISLYDCRFYQDGSPGKWNDEAKIEEVKRKLGSPDEIAKRVYGRFVMSAGRAFPMWDPKLNRVARFPHGGRGLTYVAVVDPGTGGEKGHPAAVVTLGVDHARNLVCVFNCWRGDGVETTSTDIVKQMDKMTEGLPLEALVYDHASRDFRINAERYLRQKDRIIPIVEAKKDRVTGFDRVNSLLQAGALVVPDEAPPGCPWFDPTEVEKLRDELVTVLAPEEGKRSSGMRDDLTDCLRYGCMHAEGVEIAHVRRDGLAPGGPRRYRMWGRHKIWDDEVSGAGRDDLAREHAAWGAAMGGLAPGTPSPGGLADPSSADTFLGC